MNWSAAPSVRQLTDEEALLIACRRLSLLGSRRRTSRTWWWRPAMAARMAGGSPRSRTVHQSVTWRRLRSAARAVVRSTCSGLPTLLDAVCRQLPVGIALGGGGEGLFAGEVTEFELGVVVAVAHDVGVVAYRGPGTCRRRATPRRCVV